jgi:hypothetical protein
MSDLETKIAEARERIVERELSDPHEIFDAAVAFMREVIAERDAQFEFEAAGFVRRLAEKDVKIARLKADLANEKWETAGVNLDIEFAHAKGRAMVQPRKATGAQRERIEAIRAKYGNPYTDNSFGADAIRYLLTVIESTDEPAAK